MELYEEYGKLMIQLEILQSKIQQVKRNIAESLNKPKEKKENTSEDWGVKRNGKIHWS